MKSSENGFAPAKSKRAARDARAAPRTSAEPNSETNEAAAVASEWHQPDLQQEQQQQQEQQREEDSAAPRSDYQDGMFSFAKALRRAGKKQRERSSSCGAPAPDPGLMRDADIFQRREIRRKRTVANIVLEKILANLGVLSEVKVGDKLDFTPKGTFVIQKPTWLNSAHRLLKGTDRWQTFEQVENVVGTAESVVDEGSLNDPRIREALINCVHGLRNLQQTYLDDVTFKTRMEVLVQRIELRYDLDDVLATPWSTP